CTILKQPQPSYTPIPYTTLFRSCINTASCEEPESNQTSIISSSFVNLPLGLCSEVNPSGNKSSASHSNHTFDPCSKNSLDTCSTVSSVMIGSLFRSEEHTSELQSRFDLV